MRLTGLVVVANKDAIKQLKSEINQMKGDTDDGVHDKGTDQNDDAIIEDVSSS